MKGSSILSYTGLVMEIVGIILLIPIIIAWVYGENTYIPFLTAAILSFVIGAIFDKKFEKKKIRMESAMVLSAVALVIISIVGAIPYMFYMLPVDAFFESVSGFTTTGLTVITPEMMPLSILFWRSATQWLGGLGILIVFLLLLGSPGMSAYHIYRAEGRTHRIEPSMHHTIKRIFYIYCGYTIIGIVLLLLVGMPLFDAFNHSLTSVSTGGFSIKDASIGAYSSGAINFVIIILMILGATSFFVHDEIIKKKFMEYIKNQETRLFWLLTIIFSILMSLSFFGYGDALMQAVFHTISALTTTGFTIASGPFPASAIFFMMILMIIGGYAGSTAGGIKLVRLGIIGNSITWLIKKASLPITAIIPIKSGDKTVSKSEITMVSLFVFIYIALLGISSIVLSMSGYSPIDSMFQTASAQGTVGLSTANIALLNPIGKLMLIINMFLGRLEILPFLVLVYEILHIKRRLK